MKVDTTIDKMDTDTTIKIAFKDKEQFGFFVSECIQDAFRQVIVIGKMSDACKRVRAWLNEEHKEKLTKTKCEQILFNIIELAEKEIK